MAAIGRFTIGRARRLPIIVAIDVEPDPRETPVPCSDPWRGFELAVEASRELRAAASRATKRPAHFSWFLRADPQIKGSYGSFGWGLDHYRAPLAGLVQAGDELGLHTHSWRWDAAAGSWVSDQADAAWVAHCVDESLAAYAAAFGRSCRAYRSGDRFWSAELWRRLIAAGVEVDLTLEPGAPAVAGLAPEERTTGVLPFLPAAVTSPFPVGDPAQVLFQVPLTSLVRGVYGETLVPWLEPNEFRHGLEERLRDPGLRHLAFAMRTDLPHLVVQWGHFLANIATLSALPGATFLTASEARAALMPT